MNISAGAQLGRYEIRSLIGAGGMGQVYRARDTKLGRDVAIKVLPAAFSAETERLHRFEQEAQAAGSLNHPNILAIYDVGTHDDSPYLVSELLEGETLRDRLNGAALSPRKATDYALQITQGLATAHEKGIVHRDLKPENIFITNEGRVKILDFGLAKLIEPAHAGEAQTEVPTQRAHTEAGVVIGTAGYMSPEQVRGLPADHRSDIFSFGAVFHEMLSGRRAFHGDSVVETLSAILKEDPPDFLENQNIPPGLKRVVEHCLEKNAAKRFQTARDLGFALDALSGSTVSSDPKAMALLSPERSRMRALLPWLGAGAVTLGLVAAVFLAAGYFRRAPAESPVVRFAVSLPENATFFFDVEQHNLSISPDGRRLVFVATSEGHRKLWLRSLGSLDALALPGTEGGYSPFWSPDSRYIAFFAGGKLRRIEPSGTSLQTICELSGDVDTTGAWGREGAILYTDRINDESTLFRVTAGGGAPTQVSKSTQFLPKWVHFLSDGRHYLTYRFENDQATGGIYAASLDSSETSLVLRIAATRMEYTPGYLFYAREGTLLAQPFDEKNLRLSGEPLTLVEHFPYFDKSGWSEFSVSANGVLAYMTDLPTSRLIWLDRAGRETGQAGSPDLYQELRLSPDGRRLAVQISDPRNLSGDLWIHDLARNTSTRFAFGPGDEGSPVWSPDGRRLAYFSCCEGKSTLYIKDVGDAGKGQSPLGPGFQSALDWSPDGRSVLFSQNNPTTKQDLWILPMTGDRKPVPFLQTPFSETRARFSPDGRWVAFVSNETGRDEVYVTRFDQPGAQKWRISTAGGENPVWRHDGKELYFISADKTLMAVAVKAGDTFESGAPASLFRNESIMKDAFDATADGQRFIVGSSAAQTQTMPFTVVINWPAELKR